MVTDDNQNCDHFTVYIDIKSIHCTVNYTSIRKDRVQLENRKKQKLL